MSAQEIVERGIANDMVKYCSVQTVSANETVKLSRKKNPKDFIKGQQHNKCIRNVRKKNIYLWLKVVFTRVLESTQTVF